ncbi:MAG: hypothetical protein COB75_00915 [Idiomarina sp.]|nr:hypothetical protein [Idiomarina sp.]PHQ77880.1 MAG: hypothetical protein COB75_00915 [Idiomarina sp.]
MKFWSLALGVGLLTGCVSVTDDMLNNNFPMIEADEPPAELVGIWTGAMSSYLATIAMEEDGTGLFCYSWGTKDVVHKIKYKEGRIQIQDGTNIVVDRVMNERLSLKSDYFESGDYTYIADGDLSEASTYCASTLTK